MNSLITKLTCWKTIVNLRDFYLINLWNFLSGGLGWSSRTVNQSTSFNEGDTQQSSTDKPVALEFPMELEFRNVGF